MHSGKHIYCVFHFIASKKEKQKLSLVLYWGKMQVFED